MTDLRPMQVDTYRAIQAALKAYKVRHEKVPIIENIDNAKEANATLVKIEITHDGYLKIYNNGDLMTEQQFADYSKFAVSDKNPGDQSGMFGEGAKLILGADFDVSVVTISATNDEFQACYWQNGTSGNRKIEITDDGAYRGKKAADMKIDKYGRVMANRLATAEAGTTQYIKMPKENIDWISKHVLETINDNYLACILSGDLDIQYNDKKVVTPHDITLHSDKKLKITTDGNEHNIVCEYYTSDKKLDEETKLSNIVFTTYGKRVKTLYDSTIEATLQDKHKGKVTCIVKCDSLSEFVTAAKEDFRTNPAVTAVIKKAREAFKAFIIDNNMNKGFTQSARGTEVSKQLMTSVFAKLTKMNLERILPSVINRKVRMRSELGKEKGTTTVTAPGAPSGPNHIGSELIPKIQQQSRTNVGFKEGTSQYEKSLAGDLNVRAVRKRVTGLPKIEMNKLGDTEDVIIYNTDRDSFMLNLDRSPFKETFNKDKNQFNIHTRYVVFDWIIGNASTNGELNMTSDELINLYKEYHQDSWL